MHSPDPPRKTIDDALSTLYSETQLRIGTLCNLIPLNLTLGELFTLQTLERYWINLFCKWGNGIREVSSSLPAVRQLLGDTQNAVVTTYSSGPRAISDAQKAISKAQEFWPAGNLERDNARYRHNFRYTGRQLVLGENTLRTLTVMAQVGAYLVFYGPRVVDEVLSCITNEFIKAVVGAIKESLTTKLEEKDDKECERFAWEENTITMARDNLEQADELLEQAIRDLTSLVTVD